MAERIIQCGCIGNKGRFGNALFQYAFAKAYSEETGSVLEIPLSWVGRKVFKNIKDRPITRNLRSTNLEDGVPWGEVNINLEGFFQGPKFYSLLSVKKLRNWFLFSDEVERMLPKKRNYYVAAHLRWGDLVQYSSWYPAIKKDSYEKAFKKFGVEEKDVIWVSEETSENNDYFKSIKCDWLPDFKTLVDSDVLFRSNSSFSFWAGILKQKKVYSPFECDFPDHCNKRGWIDVDFTESISQNVEKYIKE